MVIHRVQWHASCANNGGSSRWRRVVCCRLYILFSDPNIFSAAAPRTEARALRHSCTVSAAFAERSLGCVPVLVKHGYFSLQGKESIFLLLVWEYWYLTLPLQWLEILSRYVFFFFFFWIIFQSWHKVPKILLWYFLSQKFSSCSTTFQTWINMH